MSNRAPDFNGFFVYNPDDNSLVGPFWFRNAAEEYANVLAPDDGDGSAIILTAASP